jgi:type IV pilus assembly protein PilV
MMLHHRPSLSRPQAGSSLVEMMVAVLILSVGLLAMAGIHAASMRETKTNQFKVTANQIASGLGDAVKSNAVAQQTGILGAEVVSINGGYVMAAAGGGNVQPANMCDNPAIVCNAADIAAVDLFRARRTARATLPQGDVFTTLAGAGTLAPAITIWVYWVRPDSGNTNGSAADRALWDTLLIPCPAAVTNAQAGAQCISQTVPL